MSDTLLPPISERLEGLRNKPKKIYKLVKADELTIEELDAAFGVAFDNEDFNDDNDLHVEMLAGITASKTRIEYESNREAEQSRLAELNVAREYLTGQGVPGIDSLPDSVLLEVYAGMQSAAPEDVEGEAQVLLTDDEDGLMVTESGEILGFVDAPTVNAEQRNILEWLGERLTRSEARQAGYAAEKAYWLKKAEDQFNAKINKQVRIQKRLNDLYKPTAESYLNDIRAGIEAQNAATPDKKPKPLPSSVKVGLLEIKFSFAQGKTIVSNLIAAIQWCEKFAPIAVKKEIQVSMIDAEARKKLKDDSGIDVEVGKGEKKVTLK